MSVTEKYWFSRWEWM